jgi:hypothetical protein
MNVKQEQSQVAPAPTAAAKHALRQIAVGVAMFVIGLVITLVTYHNAASSSSGGTYIVAWGPMIVGGVTAMRGLIALVRAGTTR